MSRTEDGGEFDCPDVISEKRLIIIKITSAIANHDAANELYVAKTLAF